MIRLTYKAELAMLAAGYSTIIGCDEVGRGCLAGPVVAAAVVLLARMPKGEAREIIRDSKTLSRAQRQAANAYLRDCVLAVGVAEVSAEEIDTINIHHASLLAMKRAVQGLASPCPSITGGEKLWQPSPSYGGDGGGRGTILLIDGRFTIPDLALSQEAVIHGDGKVLSIAAASIIAKEYRDQLMERMNNKYPVYGFAEHKGYATKQHRTALSEHGLSPEHRKTFCHF